MDNPGKLRWHVACDESGTDGQRFYGFGSLWMKYQRRGDFVRIIRDLREKHGCTDEIKWQKTNSKRYANFYSDLVELFFKHQWLAFHCIVIQKAHVNKELHGGDYDLAMRKHFTHLIANKVLSVMKAHPGRDCEFRVEVDPIASRYDKADEAFHVIANNMLQLKTGKNELIQSVVTKDSKNSENIQIADFFLGAVMSAFQQKVASPAKQAIADKIAEHLGWKTLQHDTWHSERKFNIWYFYDPTKGPREIVTKAVNLKYKLPPPNKK
ncbi:DUF3800 domain-containing protein [Sodalis ligni]|uniref:Uncharacterized protein DUF3800 n=1 Tax=Sodalis ligni TaxID=2697027 RepID=A0A4R1NR47_9GAMM|nr:DUF3800 domain-containing protein [Sodalis ligni]TCL06880.1 uncharacterized protein DUF3800 [Sodalis ligni]